jgi:hypothetical protein
MYCRVSTGRPENVPLKSPPELGSTALELEAVAELARADFSEALCRVAHVFRVEGLRRCLHRQQIRRTDAIRDSGVDERLGVAIGDRRTGSEFAGVGPRLRLTGKTLLMRPQV